MYEASVCAICGNPIEAGQAWMQADRDGARLMVHSGCLYGEKLGAEHEWEPQDRAAT